MARPREAVGCRTLICRKADSGQLNDLDDYAAKWIPQCCGVSLVLPTRRTRTLTLLWCRALTPTYR